MIHYWMSMWMCHLVYFFSAINFTRRLEKLGIPYNHQLYYLPHGFLNFAVPIVPGALEAKEYTIKLLKKMFVPTPFAKHTPTEMSSTSNSLATTPDTPTRMINIKIKDKNLPKEIQNECTVTLTEATPRTQKHHSVPPLSPKDKEVDLEITTNKPSSMTISPHLMKNFHLWEDSGMPLHLEHAPSVPVSFTTDSIGKVEMHPLEGGKNRRARKKRALSTEATHVRSFSLPQ